MDVSILSVKKNDDYDMDVLDKCKLSIEDYKIIELFINEKKREEDLTSKTRFYKNDHKLPRTVVFLNQHFYILMKTKNEAAVVGVGGSKRVTWALEYETNRVMVCASQEKNGEVSREIEINKLLFSEEKSYFVCGDCVEYKGTCNAKRMKKQQQVMDLVDKVAFFLDFQEQGSLDNFIYRKKNSNIDILLTAERIINIVHCLHYKYKIVHEDLKLENFFIDGRGNVKLGDFGGARNEGKVGKTSGTPLYVSPEKWEALIDGGDYISYPSSDIWSLGILFSELKYPKKWQKTRSTSKKECNTFQFGFAYFRIPYAESRYPIGPSLKQYLLRAKELDHFDSIISACLKIDPKARPNALDLSNLIKKVTRY